MLLKWAWSLALIVRNWTKIQTLSTNFYQNWVKFLNSLCRPKPGWKSFHMIYHSTHCDEFLWYLICVENKKKENKTKIHTNLQKIFSNFKGAKKLKNLDLLEYKQTFRVWSKVLRFMLLKWAWSLALIVRTWTKIQTLSTNFYRNWAKFLNFLCRPKPGWKSFHMIYHSTHSDEFLWYLICVENKKKENKTKIHPNTKFFPFFNVRNNYLKEMNNEIGLFKRTVWTV